MESVVPGSWFLVKPGGEDNLRDEGLPPGQPDLLGVHARAWRFLPKVMVSQQMLGKKPWYQLSLFRKTTCAACGG